MELAELFCPGRKGVARAAAQDALRGRGLSQYAARQGHQ